MTRALVMVAILHYYLWLSLGNSLYAGMVKNTFYGQPEIFGGHRRYGGRVGSYDRSHRDAADRL